MPEKAPSLHHEAELLRLKSQNGEEIPLDELRAFIIRANQSLTNQRKEETKPSDVDFF